MEIREIFEQFIENEFAKEKFYSQIGKAVDVNETKRTCNFEPIADEAKREGIRLQSVISESKGFVLIPKENSDIIVTFLNRSTGFVSLTSEIDKIHFEAGGENLKAILNDLIKEIKNAIISTPAGPGSVAPPTQVLFDAIDIRINKLFF
ncbi:hypothetical protein LCGC14_0770980 [marine sediment metagenome]|uniref:Uncharacterized protein n=1 Tax=marine sediment metagenome TaxID=412755 RepID=A0A0F9PYG0_9ZZZZ